MYHDILRGRLLYQVRRLIAGHRDMPIQRVAFTHSDWIFPTFALIDSFEGEPRRQFKSELWRCGVTAAEGFLLAHHDLEFYPNNDAMLLYFSAIVAGAKGPALRRLKTDAGMNVWSYSGPLAPGSRPLAQLAKAIADFWPSQTWGHFGHRIRPENAKPGKTQLLQRLYLQWLENKGIPEMFVFDGLELWDGQLRLIGG